MVVTAGNSAHRWRVLDFFQHAYSSKGLQFWTSRSNPDMAMWLRPHTVGRTIARVEMGSDILRGVFDGIGK